MGERDQSLLENGIMMMKEWEKTHEQLAEKIEQAAIARMRAEEALERARKALEEAHAELRRHVMSHKDHFPWGARDAA